MARDDDGQFVFEAVVDVFEKLRVHAPVGDELGMDDVVTSAEAVLRLLALSQDLDAIGGEPTLNADQREQERLTSVRRFWDGIDDASYLEPPSPETLRALAELIRFCAGPLHDPMRRGDWRTIRRMYLLLRGDVAKQVGFVQVCKEGVHDYGLVDTDIGRSSVASQLLDYASSSHESFIALDAAWVDSEILAKTLPSSGRKPWSHTTVAAAMIIRAGAWDESQQDQPPYADIETVAKRLRQAVQRW